MKKVLNLVKKKRSKSSLTASGQLHPSPSRMSLDQVSSSVGVESASAASLVYQSTPNLPVTSSSPIGRTFSVLNVLNTNRGFVSVLHFHRVMPSVKLITPL